MSLPQLYKYKDTYMIIQDTKYYYIKNLDLIEITDERMKDYILAEASYQGCLAKMGNILTQIGYAQLKKLRTKAAEQSVKIRKYNNYIKLLSNKSKIQLTDSVMYDADLFEINDFTFCNKKVFYKGDKESFNDELINDTICNLKAVALVLTDDLNKLNNDIDRTKQNLVDIKYKYADEFI